MNNSTTTTPKTTVQILTEARALISDPENWIQGEYAMYKSTGMYPIAVPIEHSSANCFCAIGAVRRVGEQNNFNKPMYAALDILHSLTVVQTSEDDYDGIDAYNDTHTHAEVLAKFDEAIAAAQSQAMGEAWARGAL